MPTWKDRPFIPMMWVRPRRVSATEPVNLIPEALRMKPETGRPVNRMPTVNTRPPFVIRPFIANPHLEALQHIENRGMYKYELSIERGRHPMPYRTLVVQSDGSLNEMEFEFYVPSLYVCFKDRLTVRDEEALLLGKAARPKRLPYWSYKKQHPAPSYPLCNAVTFPYCVPSMAPVRRPVVAPLKAEYPKYEAAILAHESGKPPTEEN